MSTVEVIKRLMQDGLPVSIDAVGGAGSVRRDADELAQSPYLDVLAAWAVAATPDDEAMADDLLLKGFEQTLHPVGFRDAAGLLAASPIVCARVGRRLDRVLEARAATRSNDREGLAAAYALEASLRLALADAVPKFRLLATLNEIGDDENGLFAEHAAKIVGVAFHTWGNGELLGVLDRLRKHREAGAEAAFEYGNALLCLALDECDRRSVITGLEAAHALFQESHRFDPDRSDALMYASVIDVVRGFERGAGAADLERAVADLEAAAAERVFLLAAGNLPDWLTPRRDRDVQWHQLLVAVPRLASELGRESWYKASEVLGRLLRVYDAERTVPGGRGLGTLLRPRIEAAFVRSEALYGYLDGFLRDEEFVGEYHGIAAVLRKRIADIREEPNPPGKPDEDVLTGKLRDILEEIQAPAPFIDRVLEAARGASATDRMIANPVVQRLFAGLRRELEQAIDYTGEVRTTFDDLILQVIRFCMDRQDAGSKELGDRGAYLFEPRARELDLQRDLRGFLVGNLLGASVNTEIEGVGKGRTDVYVGHGGWRFIMELKRHFGHVDLDVARTYVGQAASYQNTNVKLGMLGILELVERGGPPPALEECVWYDAVVPDGGTSVRHLVAFKVPGNLNRPNELSR